MKRAWSLFRQRWLHDNPLGPGLLAVSHGPKEFVDVERMVQCAALYARMAATVLTATEGAS